MVNEPKLEKGKFPEAPWLARFYETLAPFFRDVTRALNRGLLVGEHLRAFVRDVPVEAGQAFPLDIPNALGAQARGVVVWNVYETANPSATIGGGVVVEWENAASRGEPVIRIKAFGGLNNTKAYTVTLAVHAG